MKIYFFAVLIFKLFCISTQQTETTIVVSGPLGKDDTFCCSANVIQLKDRVLFLYYDKSVRLASVPSSGKIIFVKGYDMFRKLQSRYNIVEYLVESKLCLKVKSFEMNDRNMSLECRIVGESGLGSIENKEIIKIIPFSKPKVIEFENQKVDEGQVVNLRCKAQGYPRIKFIILKIKTMKSPATVTATYVVPENYPTLEYTFTHTFNPVRMEDHATYQCKVEVLEPGRETVPDYDTKDMNLNVNFLPRVTISESVKYGTTKRMLDFKIVVQANPEPVVTCSALMNIREPRKITVVDGQPNQHTYSILFQSLSKDDEGDYKCSATNRLGVDTKVVSIRVSPSQPSILSKSSTAYSDYYAIHHTFMSGSQPRNVTIFIEALKNGRYELIRKVDYTVDMKPSNNTRHSLMHHVSNLTDNLQHKLSVKVCNQDGCSGKSDPIEFQTQKDNGRNRVSDSVLQMPASLARIDYKEDPYAGNVATALSTATLWITVTALLLPLLQSICA